MKNKKLIIYISLLVMFLSSCLDPLSTTFLTQIAQTAFAKIKNRLYSGVVNFGKRKLSDVKAKLVKKVKKKIKFDRIENVFNEANKIRNDITKSYDAVTTSLNEFAFTTDLKQDRQFVTARYAMIASAKDENGNELMIQKDVTIEVDKTEEIAERPTREFEVKELGYISGYAKLEDQNSSGNNHTGIDVFIPGTSFIAKTDAEGKYTINAPEGVSQLVFERSGYFSEYPTYEISVTSKNTTNFTKEVLLYSKTGNVTGKVESLERNVDFSSAAITVLIEGNSTNASTDGSFTINNIPLKNLGANGLPAQTHIIQVTLDGYKTKTAELVIESGKTATMNFLIEKSTGYVKYELPELVYIPSGSFVMGDIFDTGDLINEVPTHNVGLKSFYLGKFEVTFDQFDAYCYATNTELPSSSGWSREKYPVINVSWIDAIKYCNWLSEQEGLEKCFDDITYVCDFTKNGYRLPTEAEWEYAACGAFQGEKTEYPWGNSHEDILKLNYGDIHDRTSQTGFFPIYNGLYDMSGNVFEWCYDWYEDNYYSKSPAEDPTGPIAAVDETLLPKVIRGGGWKVVGADYFDIRTTSRYGSTYSDRTNFIGFRIAKNADRAQSTLQIPSNFKGFKNSNNNIVLSWNSVSNSKGYYIYRSDNSDGPYINITSTNVLKFTDEFQNISDYYSVYYKIRSYNDSVISDFSEAIEFKLAEVPTFLDAPENLKASNNIYKKIVLTWDTVEAATGYNIYWSYDFFGTYSKIQTTTNTTFNDDFISEKKLQFYYIQAFNSTNQSIDKNYAIGILGLKQPTLNTTTDISDEVRLTWDSIPDAEKYYVYRYKTGESKTRIGITTTNSYTDNELPDNSDYNYIVKARAGDRYSLESDIAVGKKN